MKFTKNDAIYSITMIGFVATCLTCMALPYFTNPKHTPQSVVVAEIEHKREMNIAMIDAFNTQLNTCLLKDDTLPEECYENFVEQIEYMKNNEL